MLREQVISSKRKWGKQWSNVGHFNFCNQPLPHVRKQIYIKPLWIFIVTVFWNYSMSGLRYPVISVSIDYRTIAGSSSKRAISSSLLAALAAQTVRYLSIFKGKLRFFKNWLLYLKAWCPDGTVFEYWFFEGSSRYLTVCWQFYRPGYLVEYGSSWVTVFYWKLMGDRYSYELSIFICSFTVF